jgi:hypothetical protein
VLSFPAYAVRRLVDILVFLMFVNEGVNTLTAYADKLFTPFSWVDYWLFDPLPIKLRPFDLILVVVLLAAGAKGQRTAPMKNTIFLALGTTVFWFILGVVLRGGDGRSASWQVYLMLMGPISAFAVAATHTKPIHFRELGKYVVAAALYRATMCIIYYLSYVRNSADAMPPMMGHHYDTVLWVSAISMLVVNFLEHRTSAAKAGAYLGIPLMLLAIQFNNRRLAWVSLAGSLLSLYFLLPPSAPKRRLKRIAMMVVPVLGVYVLVGWGRPERIFKPLSALSSVSSKPDGSTLARNAENLGLIATASFSPRTGTGWGHKYIEISDKYSIATQMELWPYVPHNSILGLFAYTGFLGVIGYWLMIPTAVFLHARTTRLAKDPLHRSIGLAGVMIIAVCLNQMFGDMGIFSPVTMYMLALSMAAALRIPLEAGAWGPPRSAVAVVPDASSATGQTSHSEKEGP